MTVNKPASRRTLKSDLSRVDAHIIQPNEYQELPGAHERDARSCQSQERWPSEVFEPAKTDITSAARGHYRTLEGDRPGLEDPYG